MAKEDSVVPLSKETRSGLSTREAARHLNRSPATLHHWSHEGTYPDCLKPERVRGRLSWPVAGLRKLLEREGA